MYNAYLATRQKARKQREDSPSTAGMAKTPSGGPKSREELKAMGERNGWSARELSMRDINAMSADETLWHETFNKGNFDRAFTLAENQPLDKERMPILDSRRMWSGRATPEDAEKARTAGDQFATRFPQFERSVSNAKKMIEYMETHDLDGTQLSSYISAFRALTERRTYARARVIGGPVSRRASRIA